MTTTLPYQGSSRTSKLGAIAAAPGAETQRKSPTPTCTDHCATCERHFHGLGAFDAHRVDGECAEPSEVTVTARDSSTHPGLQLWTDSGACRLSRGVYKNGQIVQINSPVAIWQVWQSEQQKEALARFVASRQGALL